MSSTSNINIQGNTFNNCNVDTQQNVAQSKSKEPAKLYGFPEPPTTVYKREADVEELRELMSKHSRVLITGIGGLGKTTLATLCACQWMKQDLYKYIVFVNLESDETARDVYKNLATIILGTKDFDSNINEIYKYYDKHSALFILDNIEEHVVLKKYYPSKTFKKIHVLATSQCIELKLLFHPYLLEPLNIDASVNLCQAIFTTNNIEVPPEVNSEIKAVVHILGYHPLALQHAASLITDMFLYDIPKMSLVQCFHKYNQHFETKLKEEFPSEHLDKYNKSVFTALVLNIEKATKNKEHVRSLLYCMSYLDPSHIDIRLFYKHDATNETLINDLRLRQLNKYSLISVDGRTISIHRLIPTVCHAIMTADDRTKHINILLNMLFNHEDVILSDWLIGRHCYFIIGHFEMNEAELETLYKEAFHNSDRIKEQLTARLHLINCEINDTKHWSVRQCSVFAQHWTFYKHFNKGNTCNLSEECELALVQVIKNSRLYLFGYDDSILEFYKNNKEKLNEPVFKNLPILSFCAAFDVLDDDFNKLLDLGCDMDIEDDNGVTPILWAAKNMSYELVFTLHKRGASHDGRYKDVLSAAAAGDRVSVLTLLTTSNVNFATGDYGKMLLWWAVHMGYNDIARELIQRDADTSGADGRSNTLFHALARGGSDETIIQFINTNNINNKNNRGDTALMIAASNGHDKITLQLAQAGANVNTADEEGYTPLHWAARYGNLEVVTELVKRGACVDRADILGSTPLLWATFRENHEVAMYLIEQDACVNTADDYGNTPLLFAVRHRDYDLASELITRDAQTDTPANYRDETPLSLALKNEDDRMKHIISSKKED